MSKVTCVVCGRELEVASVRSSVSYACSEHVAAGRPQERVKAMSELSRKHGVSALSLVKIEEPEEVEPEPEV